jgi:hypothetical protein
MLVGALVILSRSGIESLIKIASIALLAWLLPRGCGFHGMCRKSVLRISFWLKGAIEVSALFESGF